MIKNFSTICSEDTANVYRINNWPEIKDVRTVVTHELRYGLLQKHLHFGTYQPYPPQFSKKDTTR